MRFVPLKIVAAVLCALVFAGCTTLRSANTHPAPADTSAIHGASQAQHVPIRVVTTFSTLNSFVRAVGGDHVQVTNLVPVGASPENYEPTPEAIAALSQANLIVQNGLGIETWLQQTIANAGNHSARVVVLSDGLKHIVHNPHLWMDPVLAQAYVGKIRDALSSIDPANKSEYERNAKAYNQQLAALRASIARQIATIPPQHRAMIIFHNAFDYYNRRFGIRTVGVIELSPGQDPSPPYVARLVDLARANHVRAVFSEPEYSPKLAQTLAKSAGIRVVTNLYDDSIGNDPRVHDYISMLRYDTAVITKALK